jgi:hypothetical protein
LDQCSQHWRPCLTSPLAPRNKLNP